MKEICKDGLYIGNKDNAFTCLTEEGIDITHILTIEAQPLSDCDRYDKGIHEVTLKHVRCLDQLQADLLSHLDECIQFIEDGLKNGRVLVHCSAGVSRSATVILAYMMHSQKISLNQALHDLKSIYPKADPNPGFMFQLHLFEAMGQTVDKSNSLYKQYKLQIVARQLRETGYQEFPAELLTENTEHNNMVSKQKNYKCRKCRHKLFNSENCLNHVPGTGEDFLSWNDKLLKEGKKETNDNQCTSYFIEPLPWMASLLMAGNVEGKLSCPKCSGRIGSFNWAGLIMHVLLASCNELRNSSKTAAARMFESKYLKNQERREKAVKGFGEQCSCGRWVTPAFQLHKSRIDES